MRAMSLKRLAIGLLLVGALLASAPAHAYMFVFDDAAQAVHPTMDNATGRTASNSGIAFGHVGTSLAIFCNVTSGAGLLLQIGVQIQDPYTLAWQDFQTSGNITGVGEWSLVINEPVTASCGGGNCTGTPQKAPPLFRVRMYHNNATAATYSVSGFAF